MLKEKLRHFDDLRIMRLYDMTLPYLFAETRPLSIMGCTSGKEIVPPAKRKEGTFRTYAVGDCWGSNWENGWFHFSAEIPESWRDKKLALHLDMGGETLIFNASGVPYFGLCHGSVFDARYTKTICHLEPEWYADGRIDFWAESTAMALHGMNKVCLALPANLPELPASFEAVIHHAEIGVFREEIAALRCDLQILTGLLKALPADDYRTARIIEVLRRADVIFNDDPTQAARCRRELKKVLTLPALASAMEVTAVGHAHIDIAWYWRMRESVRKSARTFASQLYNIEHYPEYVFGASQPHNYQSVKEHYPELYAKIREAVKRGRWELQGGMWVEADCNLISGESMVRQFVHGKNFFYG